MIQGSTSAEITAMPVQYLDNMEQLLAFADNSKWTQTAWPIVVYPCQSITFLKDRVGDMMLL